MSVKLFVDADFCGQSKEFFGSLNPNEPKFYPISSLHPIGNDSVSSKIGPHTRVTLYSDQNPELGSKYVRENYSGSTLEIPYIGDDWNDIVSALKVESLPAQGFGDHNNDSTTEINLEGIMIYEYPDYRNDGKSFHLIGGDHILPPHAVKIGRFMGWTNQDKLNNDVSSIKVGKGFYAVIYDKDDFTGNNMLYITQNTPKLSSIGWDNKASSISVYTLL